MCTCFVGAELRPVCSPWGALKSPAGAGVGVEGLVLTSPDLSPGRNRAKPSCEVVVCLENGRNRIFQMSSCSPALTPEPSDPLSPAPSISQVWMQWSLSRSKLCLAEGVLRGRRLVACFSRCACALLQPQEFLHIKKHSCLHTVQTILVPLFSISVIFKQGVVFPSVPIEGHLAMSGDIFGCHPGAGQVC